MRHKRAVHCIELLDYAEGINPDLVLSHSLGLQRRLR